MNHFSKEKSTIQTVVSQHICCSKMIVLLLVSTFLLCHCENIQKIGQRDGFQIRSQNVQQTFVPELTYITNIFVFANGNAETTIFLNLSNTGEYFFNKCKHKKTVPGLLPCPVLIQLWGLLTLCFLPL